ncbi:MAG: DUF3810 domain-containing protein [Oscillospiraceae bacterium]|nr:DUF3810 domain-containing protein [Oscillospiraceae bacterium]
MSKKISANAAAMIVTTVLLLTINAAAWFSEPLMDIYHSYIFHPTAEILSHITGHLPFSVGEIMIIIGILLVIAAPFVFIISAVRKKKKALKAAGTVYAWVLIFILFTETMNCFILYHTTPLTDRLAEVSYSHSPDDFSSDEVVGLCGEMIECANELAPGLRRDDKGNIILPGDMGMTARQSFERMELFPELRGYSPLPKRISFSILMTQLDLQGIYFPFSLEGNYNAELSPARVPNTVIHELCHVKGFIREDEATFLACLACFESDIPEVRYSGYISAMNYLFAEAVRCAPEEDVYRLRCMLTEQVAKDNTFVSPEFEKVVEEKAVLPTETVSEMSETARDTTLKVNGVEDGDKSYDRMTTLLLIYRYGITGRPL